MTLGHVSGPQRYDETWRYSVVHVNAGQTTSRDTAVVNAAEVVARYIPTEIIAAYVAVTPLMMSPNGPRTGQWVAFYLFLILTPLLVWLFAAAEAQPAPRGWVG
jgi:hypothetical protein